MGSLYLCRLYARTCVTMNSLIFRWFFRYSAGCLNRVMTFPCNHNRNHHPAACVVDTPVVISGMWCITRSGSRSQVRSM